MLLNLYSVSYLWYSTIAVIAVVTIALIMSLFTHSNKSNEIDPKLIIRMIDLRCSGEVEAKDKVDFESSSYP